MGLRLRDSFDFYLMKNIKLTSFHHADKFYFLKRSRNEEYRFSQNERKRKNAHFSGTYIEDLDAPIPGVPCLTGLFVIANSPR